VIGNSDGVIVADDVAVMGGADDGVRMLDELAGVEKLLVVLEPELIADTDPLSDIYPVALIDPAPDPIC
jgi:alkyl hydroperoxide reductase subunit AhpF